MTRTHEYESQCKRKSMADLESEIMRLGAALANGELAVARAQRTVTMAQTDLDAAKFNLTSIRTSLDTAKRVYLTKVS